jgi:hypothetical protein
MSNDPRTDAPRLAYDDLGSPAEMSADCLATGGRLGLRTETPLERAARLALRPAPSIHFDEFVAPRVKPEIEISEAATRIANALQLHLD